MLGIVLVNYKTIDETVSYINQELVKITTPHKIVIVDVACEDIAHAQAIAEKCDGQVLGYLHSKPEHNKKVYVLPHQDNLGYAKGNNLGTEFLTKYFDTEFFLFTNNDIKLVDNDVVERLIEKARQHEVIGAIGPRVVDLDEKDQSPRKYIGIWRKIIIPCLVAPFLTFIKTTFFSDIDNRKGERYTYWVTGSFFLVKAKVFFESNMFDPETFLYAEEMILSERMLKAGYKNYFLDAVSIVHEHSAVIGNNVGLRRRINISLSSNLYYYRKYKTVSSFEVLLAKMANAIYLYLHLTLIKLMKSLTRK